MQLNPNDTAQLSEVRLRSGRPLSLTYPGSSKFLTISGGLTMSASNSAAMIISAEEINSTVEVLCRYSLHSCPRELREGWFVLPGGIRVGVTGTVSETAEASIHDFSSLNFRIAREVIGCADEIFRSCRNSTGILICGSVNSGKTTILRDLCRSFGNCTKTALIDERNEIAACENGVPTNDVGALTDILTGYQRSQGILSAVRTMSPDIIFCDEIAASDDVEAFISAQGSGIRFAATIHAGSFDDLMKREFAKVLIRKNVFTHAVILSGSKEPSAVREIRRLIDVL